MDPIHGFIPRQSNIQRSGYHKGKDKGEQGIGKGGMGMVNDGCNLSFPAVGRHIKQWPWRGLELEKRADRIHKMGMLVLQEARQVQTSDSMKTVKFSKFEMPGRTAPGHDIQHICHRCSAKIRKRTMSNESLLEKMTWVTRGP